MRISLLIIGIAMLVLSYILLSPPPNTPYKTLILRAYAGICLSIAGGLTVILWMWRR